MNHLENSNAEADFKRALEVPAAVAREHAEPSCDDGPLPLWLFGLIGAILCCAAFYLGVFNGGFRGDVFNERDSTPAMLFPEKIAVGTSPESSGAAAAETESPIVRGKKLYTNPPASCITCHQPTGKGLAGSFPPLAGSEFVQGGSRRLGMILLKGLQGPIKVEGGTFNGQMPAWEKVLTDKQIAYVLTYVRQEWGNKGGEITPEQIAAARKEFATRTDAWSEADLLAVPANAELPGGASAASAAPPTSAPPAAPAPAPDAKK